MAFLQVKITSKEMIKPSSPTPSHLKNHKFSVLDQIEAPLHSPLVYYYQKNPAYHAHYTASEQSTLLKNSLANTLVRFYPLAGRIQGNESIDCNDEGAEYYESTVFAKLSDVVDNPNLEELTKLLPFSPISSVNLSLVTGIQVNYFTCGGIAIGVCISHKIADAVTFIAFMNAWASKTRQNLSSVDGNESYPKFDWSSEFPARDLTGIYNPEVRISKQKVVTQRLIFDKKTIAMLREEVTQSGEIEIPSRVEVVSAYIWKRFIEANKAKSESPQLFSASHYVNLRKTIASPMEEDRLFGNLVWFVLSDPCSFEGDVGYPELVKRLREAIKKRDAMFMKKLQSEECLTELKEFFEIIQFVFSSCTKFPLYEADFGCDWGKPVWVSSTPVPVPNDAMFLSTKCGEGIEAWVYLQKRMLPFSKLIRKFLLLAIL